MMWKPWTNFVLAVIVILMAAYGAGTEWVLTGTAIIAIIALWEGIESLPERREFTKHAH